METVKKKEFQDGDVLVLEKDQSSYYLTDTRPEFREEWKQLKIADKDRVSEDEAIDYFDEVGRWNS